MSLEYAVGPPAVAAFFRTCVRAGQRREKRNLPCWDRETWEYWVRAGRRAFGPSPQALFGQLALVETLLESDCDGETIAAELRRIDANRSAEQQRKSEMVVRDRERAAKRDHEREVEAATQKEMVRLEARRRAETAAEEAGIAAPGRARRRLVSTAQ